MSRLDEIKAKQVARIFEELGRNRVQQAMSESWESKGSPEWHRFGQGRWAFTHAANIVNRHLGYPVDIWGEWIEEWSPHDLSDEPVLAPAEQEQRDEVERLTAERDALIAVGKRQAARLARVEALAERFDSVQEEHLSQDDCQCEMKDCYECGPWHACTHDGPPARARQLRAALTGSEADTSDTQSTDQEDQS